MTWERTPRRLVPHEREHRAGQAIHGRAGGGDGLYSGDGCVIDRLDPLRAFIRGKVEEIPHWHFARGWHIGSLPIQYEAG